MNESTRNESTRKKLARKGSTWKKTTRNKDTWRKRGLLTFVLLLALSMVAACGTDGQEAGIETNETEQGTDASAEESDSFPVTITDYTGEEVTIEEQPETIVTLIPSITESAFALGLEDHIIGVSDFDNYPEEALEKEKLGGQEINAELMLSLAPDVAFVDGYHHDQHADVLDQFREAGMTIVAVDTSATQLEDTYDNVRLVGQAAGKEDEAEQLVTELQDQLAELQEKTAEASDPKKVWVEVDPDLFTTGRGTFIHDMLATLGAVNVAEDEEGWVQFTEEKVVQANPDVIISTYGDYVDNAIEGIMNRQGWQEVAAIQTEQVFTVNNDIVTRPGPRIMDGVEILAQAIYPEAFEQ